MLNCFVPGSQGLDRLDPPPADIPEQCVWADLLEPTLAEERAVERLLVIEAPSREEMREIDISHSGAFCAAVIDWSRQQGFGFSRLVSLGNQADLTETDLLPIIAEDPHTCSIALYLDSIPDGFRFLDTARQITPKVPIVALKAAAPKAARKRQPLTPARWLARKRQSTQHSKKPG